MSLETYPGQDLLIKMMWKIITDIENSEEFMLYKDKIIEKVADLGLDNNIQLALEEVFDCQQ